MQLIGEQLTLLTSSPGATRVNHSVTQVNETENKMNDICGPSSLMPLAWFDRHTHCWRTSQGTLLLGLDLFSQTWPRSGMTQDGIAYRLPPSVPLTDATGCLLSQHEETWATPRAGLGDARNSRSWIREEGPQNLENQLASRHPETIGGQLNPAWIEWLMGFPIGWTDLEG